MMPYQSTKYPRNALTPVKRYRSHATAVSGWLHNFSRLRPGTRTSQNRRYVLIYVSLCCLGFASFVVQPTAVYAQPAIDERPNQKNGSDTVDKKQIYQYRQKGKKAMDDGIYSAAARFFTRYRKATDFNEPGFADATILLVQAYLKNGAPDAAQKALDYHEKHSPGVSDASYQNDLTYWQGAVYARNNAWKKVVETIRPLTEDPSTSQDEHRALRLLGKAYARLQKWSKAQKVLSTLLDKLPDEGKQAAQARMELLKTFLAQDEVGMAEQILSALEEKPGGIPDRQINLYQIMVRLKNGERSEAYNLYEQVASQSPDSSDPDWWTVVSELVDELMAAEEWTKALNALSTAQTVAVTRPNRREAQLKKAQCLIHQEKTALAINTLNEFEKNFPDAEEIIPVKMQLGELLRETDNPLSAANYFDQIVQNEQTATDQRYQAALRRGWCFNDAEQYQKAQDTFQQAAEVTENNEKKAQALLYAGDAAANREDNAEAAELYRKIAETLSDTPQAEKARYKEAVACVKQDKHAKASRLFEAYLEEFPDSERTSTVRAEYGIALKKAGEFENALEQLQQVVKQAPEHEKAPRVLFAAYEAAMGQEDIDQAIKILTRLIDDYPETELARQALYTRAHTRFVHGRNEKAVADSKRFINKYPDLPLTAEVLVWLGDYYANRQQFEQSKQYFLKLVNQQPEADLAPLALYEAAKNNYYMQKSDDALALVEQFMEDYRDDSAADKAIIAEVALLKGDILAKNGNYEKAVQPFKKAWQLVPDTAVGQSAGGRLGEMYYSMASKLSDDDKKQSAHYKKALGYFSELAEKDLGSLELKHKVQYRKAKTLEKMGQTNAAIRNYLNLVYEYDRENQDNTVPDWYYVERAGFDVCDLLVQQDRFREAARIYERLTNFGTPASGEAAKRAANLRKAHDLGD